MSHWHEVAVSGAESAVRGFLAGMEAQTGGLEAAVFGRDLGLEAHRLAQRFRELLSHASRHLGFAPTGRALGLVAALRRRGSKATGSRSGRSTTPARTRQGHTRRSTSISTAPAACSPGRCPV